MAAKKRTYDDDDGRTIVDMSGVERPNMFGHLPRSEKNQFFAADVAKKNRAFSAPEPKKPDRPWEDHSMSRSERGAAVRGALSAALLIGLAYIVGLGLLIAILLYVIW